MIFLPTIIVENNYYWTVVFFPSFYLHIFYFIDLELGPIPSHPIPSSHQRWKGSPLSHLVSPFLLQCFRILFRVFNLLLFSVFLYVIWWTRIPTHNVQVYGFYALLIYWFEASYQSTRIWFNSTRYNQTHKIFPLLQFVFA